ncbi:glycosyl transferase [Rhizobium rhizosphaerae]|uniref:Glycosyl transferase n=1 Tax=Xaviernesmea rhizosphaerae TaxID=1672749 RepID=A0A1Q9AK69_9HYPH|nr:glycosyltransferase family 4 protein [Xaviernesmea rhizosphaerae]OLP55677.1 glycosyl transferase [Xaviernesmea rhizosphaerae]
MTRALTFAYPGNLQLKTGGYGYDRRVIEGLRALGWQVDLLALGEGFPVPDESVLSAAQQALSALPDGSLLLIDGLAYGVLDDWAEKEGKRLTIAALCHHPLALETGLAPEMQARFRQSERRALAFAHSVIVTSPMTARELSAHFDVEPGRITVALPGTDRVAATRADNAVAQILSIGTLSQRKGHDVLIAALKGVEDLEWQATIIGSRDLDPATAAALERQIAALGLQARIDLAGAVEDPAPALARADLFALASRFEGYGMVFAEALAHGLPIIACHAGAVPEVVPSEAGILVPVDDVTAFSAALRTLLSDPAERQRRADAARAAGAELPGWDDTAAIISKLLDGMARDGVA